MKSFWFKKKKRTTKKLSNLLWLMWLKWLKLKHKLENIYLNLLCLPFFLSNNEESCQLFVHQARLFLVVHKEINTNDKNWKIKKLLVIKQMFVKDAFFHEVYLYLFISRILVPEICRILNIFVEWIWQNSNKKQIKGFLFRE